jgi:anti-sigma28 factor (negative regulator of flagellin synthesis)
VNPFQGFYGSRVAALRISRSKSEAKMRISNEELRHIAVQGYGEDVVSTGANVILALESPDMQTINAALSEVPDTREQLIASLKERIESGTYQVTGEQIAEMMVRRSLADRMR